MLKIIFFISQYRHDILNQTLLKKKKKKKNQSVGWDQHINIVR
jgi:hypothetical protein